MRTIQTAASSEAITPLLEQRNYADASAVLSQMNGHGCGAKAARLALAYFQAEKYNAAAKQYTQALTYEHDG